MYECLNPESTVQKEYLPLPFGSNNPPIHVSFTSTLVATGRSNAQHSSSASRCFVVSPLCQKSPDTHSKTHSHSKGHIHTRSSHLNKKAQFGTNICVWMVTKPSGLSQPRGLLIPVQKYGTVRVPVKRHRGTGMAVESAADLVGREKRARSCLCVGPLVGWDGCEVRLSVLRVSRLPSERSCVRCVYSERAVTVPSHRLSRLSC